MTSFDIQVLRAHRNGDCSRSLRTQMYRAQRRLGNKGFLCWDGRKFKITQSGIEYLGACDGAVDLAGLSDIRRKRYMETLGERTEA